MSEWVSVDDRLPEKIKGSPSSAPCIAYSTYDNYQLAALMVGGAFVHFETGRIIHGGVTHWMPLPEPPK